MNTSPLAITSLSFLVVLASGARAQECHDLDAVTAAAQGLLQQSPLFGRSCVLIEQADVTICEQSLGNLGPNDVLPIASATKTLAAAVLMSLVDDGMLKLSDPVGK